MATAGTPEASIVLNTIFLPKLDPNQKDEEDDTGYIFERNGRRWKFSHQDGVTRCGLCITRPAMLNFCGSDKHFFCKPCIDQHISTTPVDVYSDDNRTCPNCRKEVPIATAKSIIEEKNALTTVNNINVSCVACDGVLLLGMLEQHPQDCVAQKAERLEKYNKKYRVDKQEDNSHNALNPEKMGISQYLKVSQDQGIPIVTEINGRAHERTPLLPNNRQHNIQDTPNRQRRNRFLCCFCI
ncbi:hypothetical protein D5018_14040 [Parashewanella curva]|uniref:RING-type domain-containing protein n=1 Tax=Parashewanella curva TaxID=2338552 RepID=A0A3L8PUH1_9GAMM|nr:hypothetical protein [Parashewanella curva]RLV59067.1 hypothetical protein D5018_14040 [Parashewanella curva]